MGGGQGSAVSPSLTTQSTLIFTVGVSNGSGHLRVGPACQQLSWLKRLK